MVFPIVAMLCPNSSLGFGLSTLSAVFKALADPQTESNLSALDISQNDLGDKGISIFANKKADDPRRSCRSCRVFRKR